MNYVKVLTIIIAGLALFACEREIDLELEGAGETVIVEGYIYEDSIPILTISRTFSFYDKLTEDDINDLFINGAEVKLTTGGVTTTLSQYTADLNEDSTSIVTFYSLDFADVNASNFVGERGKTYNLNIKYEGKEFTASTYIPNQTSIDSIWYEPHPDPEDYEDLVKLYVRTSDADTLGNKYRVYTQRNEEDFYTEDGSVFDDTVINGTSYDVPVSRAPEPFNDDDDFNTYGYFTKGDNITVRRCGIDKDVYTYFSSLEYIAGGGGGPFGSATILNSNVKGDGVKGVWAGFSVEEISISVPE